MTVSCPQIHLAPMEGVIDFIMRESLSRIGGVDKFVTEFIRVTDKLLPSHVFYRDCPELKTGGQTHSGVPVYVQLLGGQSAPLADNAALACELGAPGIDLNFGCPAKTVNRHDGGAALLKSPQRLFDIVSAVRKSVPHSIPVTAKVRLGFDTKKLCLEIAQAVNDGGASSLTVHARTKMDGYKPPAHWEFIALMRESVRLPVIANGEIWSVEDYWRCREISGCQDVALGRGLIARPDLARQIRLSASGCTLGESGLAWSDIIHQSLVPFVQASFEHKGNEFVCARTKQWIKLLGRNYSEASELFEQIKRLKNVTEILNHLQNSSAYSNLKSWTRSPSPQPLSSSLPQVVS